MKPRQNWLLNTSMCVAVSRVTRKGAEEERVFLFSSGEHRFCGSPTLIKIWWPELFHRWLSCQSVKLTTLLHILSRLRITATMILLPHTASHLTPGTMWPLCCYRWYIIEVKYVLFSILLFSFKTHTFREVVLPFLSD